MITKVEAKYDNAPTQSFGLVGFLSTCQCTIVQWAKIWKKVQFREAALFPSKAKINIFSKKIEQSIPEGGACGGEENFFEKHIEFNL